MPPVNLNDYLVKEISTLQGYLFLLDDGISSDQDPEKLAPVMDLYLRVQQRVTELYEKKVRCAK